MRGGKGYQDNQHKGVFQPGSEAERAALAALGTDPVSASALRRVFIVSFMHALADWHALRITWEAGDGKALDHSGWYYSPDRTGSWADVVELATAFSVARRVDPSLTWQKFWAPEWKPRRSGRALAEVLKP